MIYLGLIVLSILGMGMGFKTKIEETIEENSDSWTRFDPLFKSSGAAYSVDWTWIKAICMNESSLGGASSVQVGLDDPTDIEGSKSSDGKSWGIMQMTLSTARDLDRNATEEKLNNAEYSVMMAAKYISGTLKKYFNPLEPRYMEWVVKSYNQGAGNSLKERKGEIDGYAEVYWERFQRNLTRVKEKMS